MDKCYLHCRNQWSNHGLEYQVVEHRKSLLGCTTAVRTLSLSIMLIILLTSNIGKIPLDVKYWFQMVRKSSKCTQVVLKVQDPSRNLIISKLTSQLSTLRATKCSTQHGTKQRLKNLRSIVLINVNLKIVKWALLYKNCNRRFSNVAFLRVYKTKYR